nr:LysR family transcriptional regulator [Clostridioides sp.]
MNLYQLKYVKALSKYGNMNKAAEELNISQSDLTMQVSLLEKELNCTLFIIDKSDYTLTNSGQCFLEKVSIIIDQESMLKDHHFLDQDMQNTVRIAAIPSIANTMLPPILKEMTLLGYHYEVFIISESQIIEQQFYLDEYDIGFAQDIKQGSICILKEPYCAVVPINYPLAEKNMITINDLLNVPLILPDKKSDIRKSFEMFLNNHNYRPDSFIEVSQNDPPIISFIEAGMGVTILPKLLINNLPNNVKAVEILDKDFYRTVNLLSNSSKLTEIIINVVNIWFYCN